VTNSLHEIRKVLHEIEKLAVDTCRIGKRGMATNWPEATY
jgi:hypothetical protein